MLFRSRRIFAALGVVFTILVLGILARHYASMEWLIAQETQLRAYVRENPIRAWMIGFAVYVCLTLIPGMYGKAIVIGWLYGFWPAVVLVDTAMTVAALITFHVSRYIFRETIEARFGVHLGYFRKKLESNAGFYLLTVRLLHAPFSFVNYASGATNIVPASTFWWTTQVGILPGTMVFVFAGTRIPNLSVIAEKGAIAMLDPTMLAAFVATSILPVVIRGISALITRWVKWRHNDCGQTEGDAGIQESTKSKT